MNRNFPLNFSLKGRLLVKKILALTFFFAVVFALVAGPSGCSKPAAPTKTGGTTTPTKTGT
jgi:hypothetical protein